MRGDTVHAPADFQVVAVGILEFDGDLLAGTAAPLEMQRHAVPMQMVAGFKYFLDRSNLKGEVMQFAITYLARTAANQGNAVVIIIAADKSHTAGHH